MFRGLSELFERLTNPDRTKSGYRGSSQRRSPLFLGALIVAISALVGIGFGVFNMKTVSVQRTGIVVESNVIISSVSRADPNDIHYFETIMAPSQDGQAFKGIRIPIPDSFEDSSNSAEVFFDSARINSTEATIEKGESKNGRTTYTILADENAPANSPGEPNKIIMQYRHAGVVLTDDSGRARFSWALTRQLSPAPEKVSVSVTLPLWASDCQELACKPACICKIKYSKGKDKGESSISGDFITTKQGQDGGELLTYQAATSRPLSVFEYVSCSCDF